MNVLLRIDLVTSRAYTLALIPLLPAPSETGGVEGLPVVNRV